MMSAAQEIAYDAAKKNMTGRFVIFDGEVWVVRSVYYPGCSPGGIHYLLHSDSHKFYQVATTSEIASCLF
jgi:hypothetical protein